MTLDSASAKSLGGGVGNGWMPAEADRTDVRIPAHSDLMAVGVFIFRLGRNEVLSTNTFTSKKSFLQKKCKKVFREVKVRVEE